MVRCRNSGLVQTVSSIRMVQFSNHLMGAPHMIQKALMVNVEGYDAELRSGEESDLWLRFLESGATVHNLAWPLSISHLSPAGLCRDHKPISYWRLESIRRYFARIGKISFE